ncbi:MAG: hypothetical protein AAFN27_06185 [Pseudomonadota bacterium]
MSDEGEFSEADRAAAYEFARQEIAEAKAEGAERLHLSLSVTANKTRALTTLPPEIAETRIPAARHSEPGTAASGLVHRRLSRLRRTILPGCQREVQFALRTKGLTPTLLPEPGQLDNKKYSFHMHLISYC